MCPHCIKGSQSDPLAGHSLGGHGGHHPMPLVVNFSMGSLPCRTGSECPRACSHPGPLPWLFLQNPIHTEPDTQQSQNPNLKSFRVWTEYARRFCSVRWYWFRGVIAQIQNAPSAKPSFRPLWFNQPQNVRPPHKPEVSLFILGWTRPQNSRSRTEEEKQRLSDSSKHGWLSKEKYQKGWNAGNFSFSSSYLDDI